MTEFLMGLRDILPPNVYEGLIEPLTYAWFVKGLLSGCLVAVVCGVVGCFVVLRRLAFLGDALAHAMLAGITAGYLLMKLIYGQEAHAPAMLIGAVVAAVISVGLVGFISRVSRIKEDAAIGIVYTGIFAVGGVLVSLFAEHIHIDLYHFLVGNILNVSDGDLWLCAIVTAFVLTVIILFYRQLQLIAFDSVMAASLGIPVLLLDYLLTTCVSFVVVSSVTIVGMVLVIGLLVTPAATAYLCCDRLSRMMFLSPFFALSSVIGGMYLALWYNLAGGSPIILFAAVQFLVVLVVAPKYGLLANWLRLRQMVSQEVMEKVLRTILRQDGEPVSLSALESFVDAAAAEVRRAVRLMDRQGFLAEAETGMVLTERGHHEARRILRAHRLWESYLQHVGTPEAELHDRAEVLQHVHDEETVDYLDDKLGHPLLDPHGAEIPEDFVHLDAGEPIKASLLRKGHEATVQAVDEAAAETPIQPGMKIRVGPRREGGSLWTFVLPDGEEVLLNHDQADAVMVHIDHIGSPSS